MLRTTASRRALWTGLLTAAIVAGALRWSAVTAAQTRPTGEPSPEYATLQQDRLATLRKAADAANQFMAQGTGSLEQANRLNHELVETELAAAAPAPDRLRVLTDALRAAKNEEDLASQRFNAGLASTVEPLEAKAYRLGIEMKLSDGSVK